MREPDLLDVMVSATGVQHYFERGNEGANLTQEWALLAVRDSLARIRAVVELADNPSEGSKMEPDFWYALHCLTDDDRRLLKME